MPVPIQVPKIDLPGAEYFALAPNRDILIGPRLFGNGGTGAISVPAATTSSGATNFLITPNWGTSDAFFLVRAFGQFAPLDTSGQLQVTQARMGIGQPIANIFIDLGIPTATFSTPPNAEVVIYERDAFISNIDTGPNWPNNTPLSMIFQVSVKNLDGAAAHSFAFSGTAIWHLLRGFVQ